MRAAGLSRLHLQFLAGLAVAALAMIASFAAPQAHLMQGWLIDSTAAARAMAFGIRPLDQARVIVVTLGGRSLDSEELFNTPRALFSPIWAALAGKALRAGRSEERRVGKARAGGRGGERV